MQLWHCLSAVVCAKTFFFYDSLLQMENDLVIADMLDCSLMSQSTAAMVMLARYLHLMGLLTDIVMS